MIAMDSHLACVAFAYRLQLYAVTEAMETPGPYGLGRPAQYHDWQTSLLI
jgi:hypothetical protein